jgi:hypothetical protein
MQRAHLISIVVCLGSAASAAAGDLWINCAPGFDICLDGESVGVSETDQNGMHLRGIESGDHTIRIEKDGIALAEFSVKIGFAPNQVEVGELSAKMTEVPPGASQGAAEKQLVGTVEIASDPRECNVKFADRRIQKKHPIMTIPNIPVGEHKFWFESSGTVLSETVVVQAAQPVRVRVDFRNKRVAITGDDSDVRGSDSVDEKEGPRAAPECVEYWIEVLRTNDFEEIEPYQQLLKDLGFPRENQKVITIEDDEVLPIYKLRVGPIPRSNKAKWAAGLIRNAGIPTVWVLPEECLPPSERPKREFRPTH